MNHYTMYHCHTHDSLLDSCTKYQDYVDLAVKNGQPGLSFSEHGKPLNWTEKWHACKEAGIKYIHSVEIYMTETLSEKVRDNYHTILMAKNMDGVRELNSLVSKSCDKDHFYYVNRISFDEFLSISDNIITTSACLASPLNKLPLDHPRFMELAEKYTYLEIQPHNCEEQILFNKRLYELSKELGKPLIAGTDTHSSSKYKAECRHVLLASHGKTFGNEDSFDLSYKTYDELVEMFKVQNAIPEEAFMQAIENTNVMCDSVEEIDLDTNIKYPILYGSREADDQKFDERVATMFRDKVDRGIIPQEQIPSFRDAMREEMRVFKKLEMTGFMLSMSEIVSWCKENGIALGPARGSVGGSRIAYVTDIIDLNPETWDTVFSRFANEDRKEIGDIDIDCIESDRPAIFKYIIDRFGVERTARVASFGTAQDKKVIDDVGRYLAKKWDAENPHAAAMAKSGISTSDTSNPWSLSNIKKIKQEFDDDPESTKSKYPELFYYFDGLLDTKVSQSVHPAGIVISPITLSDNYGTFDKDGEICLMLDMDNIHDFTGLAKYDFLILKTVEVIRDVCRDIGIPYPRSHEINWDDEAVWTSMTSDKTGIFQMESPYAFTCLKKFRPKSLKDMAMITAAIRPSAGSFRDDLMARKPHKNPSPMIDKLLEDNLGYLLYQCDTIKFLQQICGLSGSDADNVRRAIGRKQKDRLDAAMPDILEGYCSKSDQPREVAEQEAREFLQIIEDSASYQFGYNHAIAYCMLGYLCAYFRYYYPGEFLTSFLNNAANDDDIMSGTEYAKKVGIEVTMPKWGISRGYYSFDKEKKVIAKGLSSIKYMGSSVADELYNLSKEREYTKFIDVLIGLSEETTLDSNQLDRLIKIDFFSDFGNQRELLRINSTFVNLFKKGSAKKINKSRVAGTEIEDIVRRYSIGVTKSGGDAKSYTIVDMTSLLYAVEDAIKSTHMEDLDDLVKIRNFNDIMGYVGYTSGKPEDRRKLYITSIRPATRKKDGKQFGMRITTKSVGSGKESMFTIYNRVYDKEPVKEGDIIYCDKYDRTVGANGKTYFDMKMYHKVF